MNEAETRAELIDPALKAAGWGVVEESRVRREVITLGRLQGAGQRAAPDIADYVLTYRNHKLAVIEAKRRDLPVTEGLGQAKKYAAKLQTRFTYATNGLGIYQVDMHTGAEGPVAVWPTPDALWALTFAVPNAWRDRFAAVPFEDKGGQWQLRYYQDIAVDRALEAIAAGRDRILLTLATGTGKTAIAFQLAWKLFHGRWNLKDWREGGEPSRRPRILFLADRNILADQAYNDFSAFPEDALVRIDPDDHPQEGPRAEERQHLLHDLPDLHERQGRRGRARAQLRRLPAGLLRLHRHRRVPSRWRQRRGQLARHPGVFRARRAARPDGDAQAQGQRRHLRVFRRPGLRLFAEGRHQRRLPDAFQGQADRDHARYYVYTSDDQLIEGEIEEGKRYDEDDFNRVIEIKERESYRVKLFMDAIDQRQKTLVFCATQDHALAVRDLVNQMKTSKDPNYCVRVTARDGALGDRFLRTFQDNEKTIPTILTTSQKLSTGVDARNVRNIVLMRPIKSMIEFKQIIGRGTRLFEGKDYFTIYDFVKAYEHFNDPEWDGEPLEPVQPTPRGLSEGPAPAPVEPEPAEEDEAPARRKIIVKLADGKERTIQHMMATTFWSVDGRPMSAAEFVDRAVRRAARAVQGRGRAAPALEQARHAQGAAGEPGRQGLRPLASSPSSAA